MVLLVECLPSKHEGLSLALEPMEKSWQGGVYPQDGYRQISGSQSSLSVNSWPVRDPL